MKIDHLINAKPVASRSYFQTVNPSTHEVLAEVASGGATRLSKLGDQNAQHHAALARTDTEDTGQPIAQTGKQLIPRAADNFYYFAEMCVRVDGHTYPTPTHLNYTLFQPVGVCALISPWNVPFMTATWKVAPALAFGNTAVLKMSELSPLTAARLGELALEAQPVRASWCRNPSMRISRPGSPSARDAFASVIRSMRQPSSVR